MNLRVGGGGGGGGGELGIGGNTHQLHCYFTGQYPGELIISTRDHQSL